MGNPQGIVVVEVKSCTKDNEVRQLRMGIGQVLDYDDSLRARGRAVLPVLYLEREPSDARWVALAERHHVRLIWPGTEHVLFQERSPASVTAGLTPMRRFQAEAGRRAGNRD